jgi:hypothetical protein
MVEFGVWEYGEIEMRIENHKSIKILVILSLEKYLDFYFLFKKTI